MKDEKALVENHAFLVRFALDKYQTALPKGIDMGDVEARCVSALAGAAQKYDPDTHGGFEMFAMLRIRGAILDAALAHYRASPKSGGPAEGLSPRDLDELPLSWTIARGYQALEEMIASPIWPQLLAEKLAVLPEGTREIIRERFVEKKPIADIAKDFDLTEVHTTAIVDRVLMEILPRFLDAHKDRGV